MKKSKRLKPNEFNIDSLQDNAKKFVANHPILSRQQIEDELFYQQRYLGRVLSKNTPPEKITKRKKKSDEK